MTPTKITNAIEQSLKYEKRGEYEKAYGVLEPFWEDVTKSPNTKRLSEIQSAEIHLRCGSIGGCLATTRQNPLLKSLSLNLLTTARQMFCDLKMIEKIAECDNYIALSYWRLGALNESNDWLRESFSHDLSENHPIRLYSHIIRAILLIEQNQLKQVIKEYLQLSSIFTDCNDNFLKGCYFNELGLAYKKLPNTKKAISCLLLARNFYKKAKHKIYLGVTHNNMANLYSLENEVMKAVKSAKCARKIFNELGDKSRESFSLDTTAQILLKHKYYKRALLFSGEAVRLLENGEAYHNLVVSYKTKIRILYALNRVPEMLETMAKAYNVASVQISEQFTQELLRETANLLPEKTIENEPKEISIYIESIVETKTDKDEKTESIVTKPIKLNFPTPQNFDSYVGIELVNERLEEFGLYKNCVAIVGKTAKIKKGDVIVVRELNTDFVHCGVYDKHMGIIGLDAPKHEPLLFDEDTVITLGKIIGYYKPADVEDDEVDVKMIL